MCQLSPVCHSLHGTPRYWCYISTPHPDHELLTLEQAMADVKTSFRNLFQCIKEELGIKT